MGKKTFYPEIKIIGHLVWTPNFSFTLPNSKNLIMFLHYKTQSIHNHTLFTNRAAISAGLHEHSTPLPLVGLPSSLLRTEPVVRTFKMLMYMSLLKLKKRIFNGSLQHFSFGPANSYVDWFSETNTPPMKPNLLMLVQVEFVYGKLLFIELGPPTLEPQIFTFFELKSTLIIIVWSSILFPWIMSWFFKTQSICLFPIFILLSSSYFHKKTI